MSTNYDNFITNGKDDNEMKKKPEISYFRLFLMWDLSKKVVFEI